MARDNRSLAGEPGKSGECSTTVSALRWAKRAGAQSELRQEILARVHRRRQVRWLGVVATITACLLGGTWWLGSTGSRASHGEAIATAVKLTAPRQMMLPD